ncbi:MAG: DMT family transporter [Hyphomonadaceae bacterium]|nr:DMT family transporter [Hyphomonadaceae bacterium]
MSDVPTLQRPLPLPPLALAMIGVMMGCMMDALIKHLGAAYTAVLIAAMRYVFGTMFSGATVMALKRKMPDGAGLRRHAVRAVASTGSAVLFFHCLTILPIAEATVLIFCAPLMIAPLAWWILGEKMQPIAAVSLVVGFVGVLITVQGAPEVADTARRMEGVISGVVASGLYALSVVLLRQLAQKDDAIVTAFLGNVFPAIYLIGPAILLGTAPAMADIPLFAVAGLTGFLLWFLLTQAYARAPAQSLAAAEYTALIWSALLGYFFFAETPRWQVWIGALVIVAAVTLSAWHSHREARTLAD